jgi:hypothetical protein
MNEFIEVAGDPNPGLLSVGIDSNLREHVDPTRTYIVAHSILTGRRTTLRTDGVPRLVPAGPYRLSLTIDRAGASRVADVLVPSHGQVHHIFGPQQLEVWPMGELRLTKWDAPLPGHSGILWLRFLSADTSRPLQCTRILNGTPDGALHIHFGKRVWQRILVEVVAVGHSSAALIVPVRQGAAGAPYSYTRLRLERRGRSATLASEEPDAHVAAIWRLASQGSVEEAVVLAVEYAEYFSKRGQVPPDMTAAGLAYVLMRAGRFDILPSWALDLWKREAVPADGLAIAAEWYGHFGCHLSALNLLSRLPGVGLPTFSDGYSLALGRLAAYAAVSLDEQMDRPDWDERSDSVTSLVAGGSFREAESELHDRRYAEIYPWLVGQTLRSWNVTQARALLKRFAGRGCVVDASSFLLRLSMSTAGGSRFGPTSLARYASIRLTKDWLPVRWQLSASGHSLDDEKGPPR